MSGPGEGDLVRVRSEDELRPGMTVFKRNCSCWRSHSAILVRSGEHHPFCLYEPCPLERQWVTAGDCRSQADCSEQRCYSRAIAEGRLYRLRDEATPQETTRHRHRERVE
jgi:hypothetical protein